MFDVADKVNNVSELNGYMFNKTLSMFDYNNLPPTIPKRELELMLQKNGYCFYTEVEGVPRILSGSLGGELDEFNNPTQIIVNNSKLRVNQAFDIKTDGVLIENDSMKMGIFKLFEKFNSLLVENQLNMEMLTFNTRILTFLSASDSKTKESAENFIKKMKDGERSVIGDNAIFDGVKAHSGGQGNQLPITELIEYQQYLKSSLYSELGINAPFNMKRERVNSGEVNQHEEQLSILVDNMKECRDNAVKLINEKYGENLKCKFSGVWGKKDEGRSQKSVIENP